MTGLRDTGNRAGSTRRVSDEYLRENGWLDPMRQAHYTLFALGVFAGFLFGVIVGVVVAST